MRQWDLSNSLRLFLFVARLSAAPQQKREGDDDYGECGRRKRIVADEIWPGCDDATGGAVGAIEEGWAPASNRSLRATRKGDAYADTRLLVRLADPASSTPE